MKTSQQGLAEIAAHEGIVTSRYKDSVGVWTIGIGHTAHAGYPDPGTIHRDLTLQEIMEIFTQDIAKFEARVQRAFTVQLTQSQFDAAVSFDFNTGAIHRATWVKQFNAVDHNMRHDKRVQIRRARSSFMNWRKPKEIIPRRQKECDLFFDGKYTSNDWVNVYSATKSGKVEWAKGRRVRLPAKKIEEPAPQSQSKPKSHAKQPDSFALIGFVLAALGSAIGFAWGKMKTRSHKE